MNSPDTSQLVDVAGQLQALARGDLKSKNERPLALVTRRASEIEQESVS